MSVPTLIQHCNGPIQTAVKHSISSRFKTEMQHANGHNKYWLKNGNREKFKVKSNAPYITAVL
jgi:hypothetical protein